MFEAMGTARFSTVTIIPSVISTVPSAFVIETLERIPGNECSKLWEPKNRVIYLTHGLVPTVSIQLVDYWILPPAIICCHDSR